MPIEKKSNSDLTDDFANIESAMRLKKNFNYKPSKLCLKLL